MSSRAVGVTLLAVGMTACAATGEPDTNDTWVGTITTAGNVTTTVNESGSVWGGTARLVEEASIGVEVGADEYMLGTVNSVVADDRRIIVVDGQAGAVRTYDYSGAFLENIGDRGQGPGEFLRPQVAAVSDTGQLYVLDVEAHRVNVYAPDGSPIVTLSIPRPCRGAWARSCAGWRTGHGR